MLRTLHLKWKLLEMQTAIITVTNYDLDYDDTEDNSIALVICDQNLRETVPINMQF